MNTATLIVSIICGTWLATLLIISLWNRKKG